MTKNLQMGHVLIPTYTTLVVSGRFWSFPVIVYAVSDSVNKAMKKYETHPSILKIKASRKGQSYFSFYTIHIIFIRNQFIRNLLLGSQNFKKLLELNNLACLR